MFFFFFFSSRRRHTRFDCDWSSDVCSSDLVSHLESVLDFINFRVGGKDNFIEFGKGRRRKGITFEVPRQSLVSATRWRIFDDLLIGNFMKTTLHGSWGSGRLYPDFTPYVAKYADNGLARAPEEVAAYFDEYRRRAPVEFLRHRLVQQYLNLLDGPITRVRAYLPQDSKVYKWARRVYYAGLKRVGTLLP